MLRAPAARLPGQRPSAAPLPLAASRGRGELHPAGCDSHARGITIGKSEGLGARSVIKGEPGRGSGA